MANIYGAIFSLAVASTTASGAVKNLNLVISSTARSSTTCEGVAKNQTISAHSRAESLTSFYPEIKRNGKASGSAVSTSQAKGIVSYRGIVAALAKSTTTVSLFSASETMNLRQVISDVLRLWGIAGICNAPAFAMDRALADLNNSLQTVWNQADQRNYWTNQTLAFSFADGESSKDIPINVQNVIGPCRRLDNKRPLANIGTIGELETFSDIYLDGGTALEPLAYHVERSSKTGNDPAKTVLHVVPAVQGDSITFSLKVAIEAPRFTSNDLKLSPAIPIPHRYVESLLLPILRYRASSFWLFDNTEAKPTIDRDYEMAMTAIGMADPLPGKSGDNKEEGKS